MLHLSACDGIDIFIWSLCQICCHPNTGGIETFLAKENSQKISKVSHLYLQISANKNNNEIKHSQGFH